MSYIPAFSLYLSSTFVLNKCCSSCQCNFTAHLTAWSSGSQSGERLSDDASVHVSPASRLWLALLTMCLSSHVPELAGVVSIESGRWRERHGTYQYRLHSPPFSSPISMVTFPSELGDSQCFCGRHSLLLSWYLITSWTESLIVHMSPFCEFLDISHLHCSPLLGSPLL